jgi:transaldolase
MRLFLDTADLDEIRKGVLDWGVITGVTTNPTLIARAGQDHETQVKKICDLVGDVSAECVSDRKDDLIPEGRRIASWHPNVIVKVPMTPDGLGAGKVLAGEGVRINVTLCFTVNQALLAAAIGAYIVSPFIGRLDDINEPGIDLIRDVVAAYRQQGIRTKVLSASLRNPIHVQDSAIAGADIGTMPFAVLEAMVKHPLTEQGVARFRADYDRAQAERAARERERGRERTAAETTAGRRT